MVSIFRRFYKLTRSFDDVQFPALGTGIDRGSFGYIIDYQYYDLRNSDTSLSPKPETKNQRKFHR